MQQIIINKIQHVTKKIISVLPWNMGVSAKFVIYLLMYISEIGKQKYNFETKAPLQMLCTL